MLGNSRAVLRARPNLALVWETNGGMVGGRVGAVKDENRGDIYGGVTPWQGHSITSFQ